MKKILLTLLVLIIFLIIGLATYLYTFSGSLLAKARPEIEKIASKTLNTQVSLGELRLSLGLKPEIIIDDTSIGEKQSNNAITVKNVTLKIDLGALFSRELKVTELRIDAPEIRLTKDVSGIKIAGLNNLGKQEGASQEEHEQKTSSSKVSTTVPIGFALENFQLIQGKVIYEDNTQNTRLPKIELYPLNLSSSLNIKQDTVTLSDSKLSAKINNSIPVSLNSKNISFLLASKDLVISDLVTRFLDADFALNGATNIPDLRGKFSLSSSELNLNNLMQLSELLPILKSFPLNGSITPNLDLSLNGASQILLNGDLRLEGVGASLNGFNLDGLQGLINIDADTTKQTANATELHFNFQNSPMLLSFESQLANSHAHLKNLNLKAFSGVISGSANTTMTAPQIFKNDITISNININQLLTAMTAKVDSPLSGNIENVSLNLSGELGNRLKETTSGQIKFKIVDALLKQINLAHEAFKGLLSIPLIGNQITNSVSPEFKDELMASDTKIRSINGTLTGNNGSFATNDLVIVGSFFSIKGAGSLSMSGAVDLKTTIFFSRPFSESLVTKVKQLRGAVNSNGELTFPLAISGVAPKLIVIPDVNGLIKLGAEAAVREGAEKLLEKALKGKSGGKGLGGFLGF